jgi:hypothetical protein
LGESPREGEIVGLLSSRPYFLSSPISGDVESRRIDNANFVVGCNNLRHGGRCNKLLYLLDLRAEYLLLLLLPLFPSKNIPTLHECHRYFFYPIPIPIPISPPSLSPCPPPHFATASWGGSINGPFVRPKAYTAFDRRDDPFGLCADARSCIFFPVDLKESTSTRASVVISWNSLSFSKLLRYINCISSLCLRLIRFGPRVSLDCRHVPEKENPGRIQANWN